MRATVAQGSLTHEGNPTADGPLTTFEPIAIEGYEFVAWGAEPAAGYRGILAIHSTALGPAVGGTRWWTYPSDEAALTDALRLARGMSYKNAMARLPMGGGKSVILGPPPADLSQRVEVLRAHGRLVERLGGAYITAEDVGTSAADMEHIAEATAHVAGRAGGSGDPSPHTARGVFRAIQAAATFRWGSDRLAGKTVALQGCGNVGRELARQLARAGARIVATDLDPSRVARVVAECGATEATGPIHAISADIFAPCALGGVLNDDTIPELRAEVVVGGANNQLLEPRHGRAMMERGITHVPDYVANAGGVSYGGAMEIAKVPREEALARVEQIYETSLMVLERARAEGIPPSDAADRIAEERIRARRLD